MVIDQIRRVAEASEHTLGWSLLISLGLALWSANAGAQAMFTALNIANEEPERRSIFHFYLSGAYRHRLRAHSLRIRRLLE